MDSKVMDFFEKFKSEKIDTDKLKMAQEKAEKLGASSQDLLLIVNLVKDSINGKYKIDKKELAMLIGTIVYVVSPIDAVPDFMPVVGWLDDIGVLSYVLQNTSNLISEYRAFTLQQNN